MDTLIRAAVAAAKVDPRKALQIVLAAIGVLTVASELLKSVAAALAGAQ